MSGKDDEVPTVPVDKDCDRAAAKRPLTMHQAASPITMSGQRLGKEELVLEFELEAPPEKVWRAVRLAEFREKWLPDDALADPDPISSVPGREVSYRIRDDAPPFFESVVTFQIGPRVENGTLLKIVHRLTDARAGFRLGQAANNNGSALMRAA